MVGYTELINMHARDLGRTDIKANHVEAYMRLEHGTLDGLSSEEFKGEVILCIECIDHEGTEEAELVAKSFGL